MLLLLAEDFQSHADYSKTRVPLKNGWSIHANHAKWVRTSSGVQSVWESGHMPVLKIEGDFHHCLIEVDFRFREEDGRWGGCRISTGHSELLPRAYCGPGQAQTVKWIDTHIYQKKPVRQ